MLLKMFLFSLSLILRAVEKHSSRRGTVPIFILIKYTESLRTASSNAR